MAKRDDSTGAAGRAIGELTGLLALLKGLPLAYDKDLQLDKEPVFRLRGVVPVALRALTGLVEGLRLEKHGASRVWYLKSPVRRVWVST